MTHLEDHTPQVLINSERLAFNEIANRAITARHIAQKHIGAAVTLENALESTIDYILHDYSVSVRTLSSMNAEQYIDKVSLLVLKEVAEHIRSRETALVLDTVPTKSEYVGYSMLNYFEEAMSVLRLKQDAFDRQQEQV